MTGGQHPAGAFCVLPGKSLVIQLSQETPTATWKEVGLGRFPSQTPSPTHGDRPIYCGRSAHLSHRSVIAGVGQACSGPPASADPRPPADRLPLRRRLVGENAIGALDTARATLRW